MGTYLPARYEDIRAIALDTEHFSSCRTILSEGRPPIAPAPPLTSDPPEHKEQRRILVPKFTVAAVNSLEPRTRSICRELIERIAGESGCMARPITPRKFRLVLRLTCLEFRKRFFMEEIRKRRADSIDGQACCSQNSLILVGEAATEY
jgi:cytochrome P450